MQNRAKLLGIVACALAASCDETSSDGTRVDVTVDASVGVAGQTLSLRTRVWDLGGEMVFEQIEEQTPAFPFSLRLVPKDGDASRGFVVEVSAFDAKAGKGNLIASKRKQGLYRANHAVAVAMAFDDECMNVACGSLDCTAGACGTACFDELPCDETSLTLDVPFASTTETAGIAVPNARMVIPKDDVRAWLVLAVGRMTAGDIRERVSEVEVSFGDTGQGRLGTKDDPPFVTDDDMPPRGAPWMFAGVIQAKDREREVSLHLFQNPQSDTYQDAVTKLFDTRLLAFPIPADADLQSADLPDTWILGHPADQEDWESAGKLTISPRDPGEYVILANGAVTQGDATSSVRQPVGARLVGPDGKIWPHQEEAKFIDNFCNHSTARQSFLFMRRFTLDGKAEIELQGGTIRESPKVDEDGVTRDANIQSAKIIAFRTDAFDSFDAPIEKIDESFVTTSAQHEFTWMGHTEPEKPSPGYATIQTVLVGSPYNTDRTVTFTANAHESQIVHQDALSSMRLIFPAIAGLAGFEAPLDFAINVEGTDEDQGLVIRDATSFVFGLAPWKTAP